jgi:hypothetical protein
VVAEVHIQNHRPTIRKVAVIRSIVGHRIPEGGCLLEITSSPLGV